MSATVYFINPDSSSGELGLMQIHMGEKMALPQSGMLRSWVLSAEHGSIYTLIAHLIDGNRN